MISNIVLILIGYNKTVLARFGRQFLAGAFIIPFLSTFHCSGC